MKCFIFAPLLTRKVLFNKSIQKMTLNAPSLISYPVFNHFQLGGFVWQTFKCHLCYLFVLHLLEKKLRPISIQNLNQKLTSKQFLHVKFPLS